MDAPGETDLAVMLESLGVTRRPGVFTFVEVAELDADLVSAAEAVIREDESITLVLSTDAAERADLPVVVEMAWLSLTVNSSLEAVGLTAAFSGILGDEGISCNVLAGYRHDHLLVPVDRADDAIAALTVSSD